MNASMSYYWTKLFLVFVFYLLVGIVTTYPLMEHMADGFPIQISSMPEELNPIFDRLIHGDHLQLYYYLWLFYDLLTAGSAPLTNPYEFIVPGYPNSFVTYFFPLSSVFVLFPFLGPIFSYNLLVLLSFSLAGVSVYLLILLFLEDMDLNSQRFKGKFWSPAFSAGLVGSFIFTLFPYRVASLLSGHPTGFVFFLVPLLLYFLELSFRRERGIYGFCAGLCLLGMFLTELHFLYFSSIVAVVFIGFRVFFFLPSGWRTSVTTIFRMLRPAIPFLIVMVGVVLLQLHVTEKYLALSKSKLVEGRSIGEVKRFSPEPKNVLERFNIDTTKYVYQGVVPPILMILLLGTMIRNRKEMVASPNLKFILFFMVLGLFFLVLMFGPNARPVPLYDFLNGILPKFDVIRQFGKVGLFTVLSISVCSGFLMAFLGQKLQSKTLWTLAAVILISVHLDFNTVRDLKISIPQAHADVEQTVKRGLQEGVVLHLPIWPGDSAWSTHYQYFTTRTRTRMINGYSPVVNRDYFDDVFLKLVSLNIGELSRDQWDLLRQFRVKYILFHPEAFPPKVSPYPFRYTRDRLQNSPYLTEVSDDPIFSLFEVKDQNSFETDTDGPLKIVGDGSGPVPIGTMHEGEGMLHRIGTIRTDPKASGGQTWGVDGTDDRADFLAYGRYTFFPAGRYDVIFRIVSGGGQSAEPVAKLEVVQDQGKQILVEKKLYPVDFSNGNGFVDHIVTLNLSGAVSDLEARIWVYPHQNFSVDYIYIKPSFVPDSPTDIQIQELFYSPYLVKQEDEFRADPQKSIWEMFKGPHLRFSAGTYRWTVRARMESMPENRGENPVIGILHVYTGFERSTLQNREIRAMDLKGGESVNLHMVFDTPIDQVLGFKIFFFGSKPLYVENQMRVESLSKHIH